MIELCCEYLFVPYIWLYVIIMSRTHFRVNPHWTEWIYTASVRCIWLFLPVWLNAWVFLYELSGCEFESRWCRLIISSWYFFYLPYYKISDLLCIKKLLKSLSTEISTGVIFVLILVVLLWCKVMYFRKLISTVL